MNGQVNIVYDDIKYNVCGDSKWNDAAADVVCRTLGHTRGRAVKVRAFVGGWWGEFSILFVLCLIV